MSSPAAPPATEPPAPAPLDEAKATAVEADVAGSADRQSVSALSDEPEEPRDSTYDVNENVLRAVHQAYATGADGVSLDGIVHTLRKWVEEEKLVAPGVAPPAVPTELKDVLDIRAPREKITVLIIGNHSAGKSSFINWYIGETIQKESAAMETSGFTFVTSGKRRDTFTAKLTMRNVGYLEGIQQFDGVLDNLSTEVSTSKARRFPLVDFIDTPGLTDGQLSYPFDVNEIIVWLAQRVNLVFVFFDPHGQATCERTMAVVRKLNEVCRANKKQKIHYFLTRANDCKDETDRMKVMVQLSQSLSRSVQDPAGSKFYGEHALEVRAVYRPAPPPDQLPPEEAVEARRQLALESRSQWSAAYRRELGGGSSLRHRRTATAATTASAASDARPAHVRQASDSAGLRESMRFSHKSGPNDFNQIDEALELIDKAINLNVQEHVRVLEGHTKQLLHFTGVKLQRHERDAAHNRRLASLRRYCRWTLFAINATLIFYLLHMLLLVLTPDPRRSWHAPVLEVLSVFSAPIAAFDQSPYRLQLVGAVGAVYFALLALVRLLELPVRAVHATADVDLIRRWRRHLTAMTDAKTGTVARLWEDYTNAATEKRVFS